MIIDQLCVFLNNSVGRISEVTSLLGAAGVNLQAFTLSESSDFGILRLITDNNDKAVKVLQEKSFAVTKASVCFVSMDDTPGTLSKYIQKISDAGISLEYMYAFSQGDKANVVICTDDIEGCNRIISDCAK